MALSEAFITKIYCEKEGDMTADLSRRSFLTGAAALGAVGMAGLAGCAPKSGSSADKQEGTVNNNAAAQTKTWRNAPDPIPAEKISEEHEADIVVLGAGQSGSCAARAAAEAGATVIVIEQMPLEGYMVNGSEVGCINNSLSVSRGAPTYKPAELVAECLRRSLNRSDPRLLKKWAENA